MRYVLELEAIGDNHAFGFAQLCRGGAGRSLRQEIDALRYGRRDVQPWVARLTGLCERYVFRREFLRGQKDYARANGTGSRGVYFYYFLEPGFYEINSRESWKRTRHYFAEVVDDQTIVERSREEIERCLLRRIVGGI